MAKSKPRKGEGQKTRPPGGTIGNIGGTGRPDLAQRVRRDEIVRLMLNELHRRALEAPRDIETRDLTATVAKFDDDLRINKTELSVRDPLKIVVSRE